MVYYQVFHLLTSKWYCVMNGKDGKDGKNSKDIITLQLIGPNVVSINFKVAL